MIYSEKGREPREITSEVSDALVGGHTSSHFFKTCFLLVSTDFERSTFYDKISFP